MSGIVLVDWGPDRSGIVQLGRTLARCAVSGGSTVLSVGRLSALPENLPPDSLFVHFHFSDWMFPDPAGAGQVVTGLAAGLHARGAEITVTLHDLPQPADGRALYARRAASYRAVTAAVDRIIVSSRHERKLLTEVGPARAVTVVPLPVSPDPHPAVRRETPARNTVGIFGFLFPGKGHEDVLTALAGFTPRLTVQAIGAPAERHPDLPIKLARLAEAAGLDFRCTGFVPDDEVVTRLQAVTVPLAPQTKISASGSINSWLMAGRRPLVADSFYAREVLERMPGSMRLYGPGGLPAPVAEALADPHSTWLPADFTLTPTVAEVAHSYGAVTAGRRA